MVVRRLDHCCRAGQRLIDVAGVDVEGVARRLRAEVLVEALLRRESDAGAPGRLQFGRRLHRLPRLLGNHTDEVLPDHNLDQSGHVGNGCLVDADQRRAHFGRAHHPTVHHAGHANVVHEHEQTRGHRRHVDARDGGAQNFPLAGRLPRGLRIQRDVEFLPADEIGVRDPLRRVASRGDEAVGDRQLIGRNAKTRGRQLEERLAGGRAGLRQVPFVEVGRMRLAPRRSSLIGCDRGVALHQPNARHRHAKLLGDHLDLRRVHPLAELALAGVGGDAAVGGDGEPRVELTICRARRLRQCRAGRQTKPAGEAGGTEADDKRAATFQKASS
jgi:hypothetical protein